MGDSIGHASAGPAKPAETNLVGFRGWLAFLALGVTTGPILTLVLLAEGLALPRDGKNIFIIGLLLTILVVQLFTAVAMWRRRSYFPKLFVVQSSLHILFGLLLLLGAIVEGNVPAMGFAIGWTAGTILWTIYVFRSRRVKNTFRRGGPNDLAKAVEAF